MRSRGYFWLPVVLSSAYLFPSAAAAETIRITGGFLEMPGEFDLVGDRRGFRMFGGGYGGGGGPNVFVGCEDGSDGCNNPGEVALFSHAFSGLDLPARATLDGIFHEDVGSLGAKASALIGFSSRHVLPPIGSTAVLRDPFTMEGSFFAEGTGVDTLVGSGIVTTTWTSFGSNESGPVWDLTFARYDFFGATPVPEPTTLVLFGVAGAAAAFTRRKRHARD
jgi:hypothetical protein